MESKQENKEFESGTDKRSRIDKIRNSLHQARASGDVGLMFTHLVSLRNEINEKMDKGERDRGDKFESSLASWINVVNSSNTRVDMSIINMRLSQYERFLGEVEYKRYGTAVRRRLG